MNAKTRNGKVALFSALLLVPAVFVAVVLCEGALRVKNLSMKNYEIEMWRYAKELKVRSPNPILGHEHKTSLNSKLQSVDIRLNEWGLRGPAVLPNQDHHRRILFLGSSITLGWGVKEEDTVTGRLQAKFQKAGQNVEVLNAGIGNYNSERYVELFMSKLKELNPTDLVVHFFLRDAELLDAGRGNWLLQNSQLAVTGWNIFQQMKFDKEKTTVDTHYRSLYTESSEGYRRMKGALKKLSDYAKEKKIALYFAMTPDIHNLTHYPFLDVHAQMQKVADEYGYRFVDLYPALEGMKPSEIWSLPSDPHPNAEGHKRMADAIYPLLKRE